MLNSSMSQNLNNIAMVLSVKTDGHYQTRKHMKSCLCSKVIKIRVVKSIFSSGAELSVSKYLGQHISYIPYDG